MNKLKSELSDFLFSTRHPIKIKMNNLYIEFRCKNVGTLNKSKYLKKELIFSKPTRVLP